MTLNDAFDLVCYCIIFVSLLGLAWAMWGLKCNRATYKELERMLDILTAASASEDVEKWVDSYRKVKYNEVLRAITLGRDWRKLYDKEFIEFIEKANTNTTVH